MLQSCFRKAVTSQLSMEHSGKSGRLEGRVAPNKLFKNHSCTQANFFKKPFKNEFCFCKCLAAGFFALSCALQAVHQLSAAHDLPAQHSVGENKTLQSVSISWLASLSHKLSRHNTPWHLLDSYFWENENLETKIFISQGRKGQEKKLRKERKF